jgi:hypothetical protein
LLRGGIRYSGGPLLPIDEHSYEAGTVNLEHDGHKVDVAELKDGQRFTFKVRPASTGSRRNSVTSGASVTWR